MAKAKSKIELPNINELVIEMLNDFNMTSGVWTVQADSQEKGIAFVSIPQDGRRAQVQIKITTDEDEFID